MIALFTQVSGELGPGQEYLCQLAPHDGLGILGQGDGYSRGI